MRLSKPVAISMEAYDYLLKQIYVTTVSDVPPGTSQSPTELQLGPAGLTRH